MKGSIRQHSHSSWKLTVKLRCDGQLCLTSFPRGVLYNRDQYTWYGSSSRFGLRVGYGGGESSPGRGGELLPGLYEYKRMGDKRVEGSNCIIAHNVNEDGQYGEVELPYGESFTFQFFTYHNRVLFSGSCAGTLYRIGD